MDKNIRSVFHMVSGNWSTFNYNIVHFTTRPFPNFHQAIDGSYLPGNVNAIFNYHEPDLHYMKCIPIDTQNVYSQAISNQVFTKVGPYWKKNFFSGISLFKINPNRDASLGTCRWTYELDLVKADYALPSYQRMASPF